MEKFTTQIKLIFGIFGECFSPNELTNLIKINPTQSWSKGDVIPLQKGLYRKDKKILYRRESAWEFTIGFTKTLDFEDVSFQFEEIFESKVSILKDYIREKQLEVLLDIVVEIVDADKPSLHFNKRIIKICEELEAEIDIDMYLLSNN